MLDLVNDRVPVLGLMVVGVASDETDAVNGTD
jgi:hypothetical protein